MIPLLKNSFDHQKCFCIGALANLLMHIPEGEQKVLPMILNKLGDPSTKVASKALHELTNVAYKHPNMCGVMVIETEKLMFRNNISDRTQRYGLCFLTNLSKLSGENESIKMVNICFAFFKKLVQRGAVNSRIMQSILHCLQKTISRMRGIERKPIDQIIDDETEGTMYRLAHLSDIQISIQAYGLLLQLITNRENAINHRFYNALYRKSMDMDLYFVGAKTAASFLHIVHKAMIIDKNVKRIKAYIKRLLQISLYIPSNISAGIVMVVNRLLLIRTDLKITFVPKKSSKNHSNSDNRCEYDAYHRVPMYAGAQYSTFTELNANVRTFHPSVRIFIDEVTKRKYSFDC